jgi:peptide/nickel transport system substrate-binding protein
MTTIGSRKLLATGLAAAALAWGLSACGSSVSSPSAAGGKPVYGGALTFYDPLEYTAWVPTNSLWGNSNVTQNLVERLIWQDPKTGDFRPWLAKSWEISSDHLSYTFHLKSGITFSNGDPLDAETVKENFDQHGFGDKKLGIPKDPFWPGYVGTDVVDPLTVKVKISKPNAAFLQVLSNYRASSILGKPFLKQDLNGQGKLENWVGTGPYVVEKVDGTTGVTLKRRDDYNWAPEGDPHQGKAYLARIVYKTVPEASTRVGALGSGEAQIARNIAPYDEKTITAGGGTVVGVPVQGETNSLKIQLDAKAPTQDLQVRLALQAATDRAEINKTVLSPSYPIPTSALVKGTPFRGDASSYLTYDLNKAKSLLDADGWKLGADGIRVKGGKKLHFDIWVAPYYQVSQAVLELLQSQWKKAGIDLQIHTASPTEYVAKSSAHGANANNDWTFEQGQSSTADPSVLRVSLGFDWYNADDFLTPDKTFESLLSAQALSFDTAQRKEAVQKVEDRIFSQAYEIPLYDETQVFGLASNVHGFATESTARSWLYDTWLSR